VLPCVPQAHWQTYSHNKPEPAHFPFFNLNICLHQPLFGDVDVSSCSRACCDCEQNCSFGPPSIRRKSCSALLAHDRSLDRRWGVKGRPPWASPSDDKPADPVMMPKALAPCSALLRDVRPRGQGASTGHGGGRAGKRCGCESCDPSRSGFHAPRPPSPSRSSHRRVLQRVSVGVVCLSLSLPGCG